MKKEVTDFWHTFSLHQKNLKYAFSIGDKSNLYQLYSALVRKIHNIHSQLDILITCDYEHSHCAKLIFLTKGKSVLKKLANACMDEAPSFALWEFQSGINPYKHSIVTLCAKYGFLGGENNIHQIYFALKKIYKTSNKLHLWLYLELDKQISKSELHQQMYFIFLYFLGDANYYNHISRYKIIRRKYSKIEFLPLDQLRHLIQYKSNN
ncbi:hypothetical protein [Aequorivita flava]|uniref:Uncharacterized protein n=1 Tax=Aequorivita flava TaxID=3114371 RepID=A0AB35YSJ3_9FLAO